MSQPRLHSDSPVSRLRCMLAVVLAFSLATWPGAKARGTPEGRAREYAVKAGFVYNFTKFVEWPAESFKNPSSPFVIGILDSEALLPELQKAVAGRKINGRAVRVQSYRNVAEIGSPHVLFIGGEAGLSAELRRRIADQSILTVGEAKSFLATGGVIAFEFEGDKLRFSINITAATRARLRISAQLQKLAQSVERKD